MRSTNHIAHTAPTSHHLTPLTARTFIIYVFSVQFADARKSNQPHTTSHHFRPQTFRTHMSMGRNLSVVVPHAMMMDVSC